ncbi:hypothetical protein FSP39_005693 [Pinctada imbricata]|uniref:Major facilitator superfamily (MFS) profile domain-containing protein n=1 Tax=Pinctada imbricata TaxID=66713 RepID=A0AA89BPZ5_PINIB|nr:hypothetical protein FSP39_005693 [Pinctada imbricata]
MNPLESETEILLKKLSPSGGESDEEDGSILQFDKIELEGRHLTALTAVVDVEDTSRSPCGSCYVVLASVMASLGGILFGYDIGIISGAVLQLREVFCLSCTQQELVISSMLIGAIIGSLSGGFLVDGIGRRRTIIVISVIFVLGAIVLAVSPNYPSLLIGRLILGFAVSVSATGECTYISEIAPAKRRGLLVSLNELGITIGLLLAYLVNYIFISQENGWRYMFGLSCIPAFIQFAGMVFLPPSPRYLMLRNKDDQAESVLLKLRGYSKTKAEKELEMIRVSIASEQSNGCTDLLSSVDNMRGRMFIGAGLVFFQQCTGQPNVLYYAPTIFEAVGFESHSASTLATVGLGFVKVVMTVISLCCVDRWGRRKFLLLGASLMALGILTLGLVSHLNDHTQDANPCLDNSHCFLNTSQPFLPTSSSIEHHLPNEQDPLHNNDLTHPNSSFSNISSNASLYSNLTDVTKKHIHIHGSMLGKIAAFSSLVLYVAAYGFSFGPVTWLVLSEIFPASVKGRAVAFTTVLNWGTNLVVSSTFLDVMNEIGVSWTFVIFSIVCVLSVLFVYTSVPETKGKSLEQISNDLKRRYDNHCHFIRLYCGMFFSFVDVL